MTGKKLTEETKAAAKAEKDRRARIEKEHQKVSSSLLVKGLLVVSVFAPLFKNVLF